MNKTLTTAVTALLACAGTQLFAQNAKQDVITFALTAQSQKSVSTSSSVANNGLWSSLPTFYKTQSTKLTQANLLKAIGFVLHGNANYYSSKAQLVMVQGELSGFFNINDELGSLDHIDTTTLASTVDMLSHQLATGRHFETNPITGRWPVGHHQPWGQIFVKDSNAAVCDNVTYFFALTVQECYDCFYLNSFISDSKFTFKAGSASGPPCCTSPVSLTGNGKDLYYLTLSFDNTRNNPYLNSDSPLYVGVDGIGKAELPADGITPDLFNYADPIRSQLGVNNPYVARFTLNGIVTYTWNLKFVNPSDLQPDFIGTGKYAANGYGFIGLFCTLLTGSATFTEKVVNASTCCLDLPWYDDWYGVGHNRAQAPWSDFFETPINTVADLTFHAGFDEEYEPGEQSNYIGTTPDYWPGPTDTVITKQNPPKSVYVPVGP